jgi:tetratricopeptide (TPR) repeat protein
MTSSEVVNSKRQWPVTWRRSIRPKLRIHYNARTLASDLNDLGIVSEEMGHYGEAREYYERELDLLKPLGETTGGQGVGAVYVQLANLSLVEGSLSASEADYKQALALLTRHAGPDDLRTAEALGGMGRLYAEWGRYEESEKLLRQARTIAEKSTTKSDWVLIDILDSEAALFCQARKFAAAEKSWLRALKIAENDYGGDGLQYSALLLHLGQLYTGIRDYPAAQAMLERGLAIEQKTKGEDSMGRAIATSALGNVYLLQHKLARAEPLFLQSLYALDGNCGTIPLACATVRSFLGDFYMAKGQWQSAEGEYEIALTLRKSALGDHTLVASSMLSVSQALRKLKRKREAQEYAARAQKILGAHADSAFNSNDTIDLRSLRAGN